MSDRFQDALWPHFYPLWTELRAIAPGLLLAGGYGLFLKQQWLLAQLRILTTEDGHALTTETGEILIADGGVRTLIPIDRWNDQAPRVTKDFDFIASLDLIASAGDQKQFHVALEKHNFKVVPKNARWQFAKDVDTGRTVVLDFHAASPAENRDDLRVQARRVKPQPSLGQEGIHARENPEAIGSELHPFSFAYEGIEIVLPNPVTLVLMKLVAMRDRWRGSQDASKSADERQFEEGQARKHAEDVCRIMAMVTREEGELAGSVLEAVRTTSVFAAANQTFSEFVMHDEGWGTQVVAGMWQMEDLRLIQSTLNTWFR